MKKVALFILSITVLLCLAACNQEQEQAHTPEHTHSFGEWSVSEDATCTEEGVKVRYCDCGEMQSEAIPAIGHNYVDNVCDKCSQVTLAAGLYDQNDKLLASWDTLVDTYGFNIQKLYYSSYDSASSTTSLYYILNNNPELSTASKLVIDNNITIIGTFAFSDCDSLTSVIIGDGVITIWDMAFEKCSNLTSVVLGDSVENIYDSAFSWCDSLTSIVIPDSVGLIGKHAFSYCFSLTSVVMGDNVAYISEGAFLNCSSLTSISIPDSVIYIGGQAFYLCSNLTSVVIPDSVVYIGDGAFNCDRLASITVDTNNTKYKSIDGNLYSIDGNVLIQYAIGKPETKFTVPDGVTSIGYGSFYGCSSLTSVVIPDSVTSIDEWAFYNCENFKDVYYTGSEEEWNAITIDSFNNYLAEATIHLNYVPEN